MSRRPVLRRSRSSRGVRRASAALPGTPSPSRQVATSPPRDLTSDRCTVSGREGTECRSPIRPGPPARPSGEMGARHRHRDHGADRAQPVDHGRDVPRHPSTTSPAHHPRSCRGSTTCSRSSSAATLIPCGVLADRSGASACSWWAPLLFTVGSLVGALSPAPGWIMVGRTVQALGAAAFGPAGTRCSSRRSRPSGSPPPSACGPSPAACPPPRDRPSAGWSSTGAAGRGRSGSTCRSACSCSVGPFVLRETAVIRTRRLPDPLGVALVMAITSVVTLGVVQRKTEPGLGLARVQDAVVLRGRRGAARRGSSTAAAGPQPAAAPGAVPVERRALRLARPARRRRRLLRGQLGLRAAHGQRVGLDDLARRSGHVPHRVRVGRLRDRQQPRRDRCGQRPFMLVGGIGVLGTLRASSGSPWATRRRSRSCSSGGRCSGSSAGWSSRPTSPPRCSACRPTSTRSAARSTSWRSAPAPRSGSRWRSPSSPARRRRRACTTRSSSAWSAPRPASRSPSS